MKRRVIILLAVVLVIFASRFFPSRSDSAPSNEMTAAEMAQIEAEVKAHMSTYVDALETINIDTWAGIFHPTQTSFAWGGTIHDHDSFVERVNAFWESWETWEGQWVETTVKVLSPDAAMFQGEYEATIHYEDGRILHWPGNANFTSLVERTPDGWKVTIGNWGNGSYQVVEEG